MDSRREFGETRVGASPVKGPIDVGLLKMWRHPERVTTQILFPAFALIIPDEATLHEIGQGVIPNRSPGESLILKEGHQAREEEGEHRLVIVVGTADDDHWCVIVLKKDP